MDDKTWIHETVEQFFPRHFAVGDVVSAKAFWEAGLEVPPSGKRFAISSVLAVLRHRGQVVTTGQRVESVVGHTGANNAYTRIA